MKATKELAAQESKLQAVRERDYTRGRGRKRKEREAQPTAKRVRFLLLTTCQAHDQYHKSGHELVNAWKAWEMAKQKKSSTSVGKVLVRLASCCTLHCFSCLR